MVLQSEKSDSGNQPLPPSRNIDELKRLVITALDKNGALAELRSTVKLHVSKAINEEQFSPLVHQRSAKISNLMSTERGQLLTELVVDFLRFYDLKDTLSMFMVEANLPKLRPSETEVAGQCGFTYVPTMGLSVLEQYLTKQPGVHYAPQHPSVSSEFDIPIPSDVIVEEPARGVVDTCLFPPVVPADNDSPPDQRLIKSRGLNLSDDSNNSSGLGLGGNANTSMENDMMQFRRISDEIERISKFDSNVAATYGSDGSDSPRYEDDFDDSPIDLGKANLSPPLSNHTRSKDSRGTNSASFSNPIDDNVLFESRESFKDLGEFPVRKHPMELNDHIESVDRSRH